MSTTTLNQQTEVVSPFNQVRVLEIWSDGDPSSSDVKLLLSTNGSIGLGHHTEDFDLLDIDAWLKEHHPEVFTEVDGKRHCDIRSLAPEVMTPCLEHARAEWQKKHPSYFGGTNLGCLLTDEAARALFGYGQASTN